MRKQGVVRRRLGGRSVEEVCQQHEAQLVIAVGQEADLQRLGQDIDAVDTGQHRGDRDHGGAGGGDTFAEIELGQRPGRDQYRRRPVHQDDAQLAEHQKPEQRGQPDGHRATARCQQAAGGHHRQQGNRQQVQGKGHAVRQSPGLAVPWRCLGHCVDGGRGAFAHEPIAHVRTWPIVRRSRACQIQRDGRNAFFRNAAPARDLLYDMAIGIAGAEIHLRIDGHRVFPQPLLDHTHVFDKGAPIHGGEEAQAADAVADGDLVSRLLLPLGGDQFVDALPSRGGPLFQPSDRHGPGAAAPLQRAGQLGDERAGQGRLGACHVGHHQNHIGRGVGGGAIEVVRPLGRQAAVRPVAHHPRRHAPQILQQGQTQHDGNGPQFAQAQRRERLVRGDESAQGIAINTAIAVRDGLHRQFIHARQSGRGAGGKRRQLPAVAARQVAARGLDLFFDQVVVVEQPFPGRGHRPLFAHYVAQQRVGIFQDTLVGLQAIEQALCARPHPHPVLARKGAAVHLHLFNAVQRGTQWDLGGFDGRDRGLALTPAPTDKTTQAEPTTKKTAKVGHGLPRGEVASLHSCIRGGVVAVKAGLGAHWLRSAARNAPGSPPSA